MLSRRAFTFFISLIYLRRQLEKTPKTPIPSPPIKRRRIKTKKKLSQYNNKIECTCT